MRLDKRTLPVESGYQLMPPLAGDDYEALKASIAAVGVLQPVVVTEDGTILDGHHRAQVCDELGIDYPTITVAGLSEEERVAQVLALNVARRHLTIEQRRELVAGLSGRGMSVRQIAAATGIPRSTVQNYLKPPAVPNGTPDLFAWVADFLGPTLRALALERDPWARTMTREELGRYVDEPVASKKRPEDYDELHRDLWLIGYGLLEGYLDEMLADLSPKLIEAALGADADEHAPMEGHCYVFGGRKESRKLYGQRLGRFLGAWVASGGIEFHKAAKTLDIQAGWADIVWCCTAGQILGPHPPPGPDDPPFEHVCDYCRYWPRRRIGRERVYVGGGETPPTLEEIRAMESATVTGDKAV